MNTKELTKEQLALDQMILDIQKNISTYTEQKNTIDAETEELYNEYQAGAVEVHNDLSVNISLQSQIAAALSKNLAVIERPFFGKINYYDKEEKEAHSFYIGKHGINKNATDILIVDWRAPVATIYYDCNLGDGAYHSIDDTTIPISLSLKRTFDIEKRKITGFYDSAAVTDDELLIKYLSQNKDAILSDIITTIQQEQNQIIREKPFHNIIVQGVAGSGKTTVAIHRISYLLYNFSNRFKASEFCILGSNHILLNYIANSLPDLDVHDTKQFEMVEFFLELLGENILPQDYKLLPLTADNVAKKSSFTFIKALDAYLKRLENTILPAKDIRTEYGCYISKEHIKDFLHFHQNLPITEKAELLDERLYNRISLIIRDRKKNDILKEQRRKYRKYYTSRLLDFSIIGIYKDFLMEWKNSAHGDFFDIDACYQRIANNEFDLYDLSALCLITFYTSGVDEMYMLKQIIIDEAQDFGGNIYFVLRKILYNANFTLMGDVSQNIHYETGINDWAELRKELFADTKSKFYTLLKSYRNTIEISNFASNILAKTDSPTYPIEPIIRHGNAVVIEKLNDLKEISLTAITHIKEAQDKEYETIAIICATKEQVAEVANMLTPYIEIQVAHNEEFEFQKGVVLIPLDLVKGLEFDTVILWNPNTNNYQHSNRDAKRLYVGVTRALHELYVVYEGVLATLLSEG
jgi:Superfamily I DNA and RNA helicases